jgi:hypothetical protein
LHFVEHARTTNVLVVGDFARKAGISEAALKNLAPRARLMRTVLKSEVLHLLSTTPVDLILAVSGPLLLATEDLARAMNSLPLPIPILVVTQTRDRDSERPHRPGEVVEHMCAPVEIPALQARVSALLAARAQLIRIEGVSLPGFVQLVEMERRSCTLFVASAERRGVLAFIDGRLVDAHSPERDGETAALEIFGWTDAIFAFHRNVAASASTVRRSLTELLLNAARLRDEETRGTPRTKRIDVGPTEFDFSDEIFEPPANGPIDRPHPARPEMSVDDDDESPPAPPPQAFAPADIPPADTPPADIPLADCLPVQVTTPVPQARAQDPPRPPPERAADQPTDEITTGKRKIGEMTMANINKTIEEAMKIDGAIGVALADYESGLCLGTGGGGSRLNIEVAAAGNCQVVKAKMNDDATSSGSAGRSTISSSRSTTRSTSSVRYVANTRTSSSTSRSTRRRATSGWLATACRSSRPS